MRRFVLLFSALLSGLVLAQGTREDYARAEQVMNGSLRKLVAEAQVTPNWIAQTSRFWYRKETPAGKEFLLVDPERNSRAPAFDHEKLAAALGTATGKTYKPLALPFDTFTFARNTQAVETEAEGARWSCDLAAYRCTRREGVAVSGAPGRGRGGAFRPPDGEPRDPARSPDGVYVAFLRDHNLWVRAVVTNQEFQLTRDGDKLQPYATGWPNLGNLVREATGVSVGGPAQQGPPPDAPIVSWSPDSTKLATFRLDMRSAPPAYALQVSPPGRLMPVSYTYAYAFPPSPALPTATPLIFDVKSGKRVEVDIRPQEILYGGGPRYTWFRDSRGIHFRDINRGYTHIRLVAADAATGKVRTMVDERADDFVVVEKFETRLVNDGAEVVITSERDGWNHLYLVDGATAAVKNRITAGEWAVREVAYVDEKARAVYFTAGGKEPGADPYLRRLYRAGLDGKEVRLLTPESADHAVSFSPDGQHFVDNYSRVDLAPTAALRRPADGSVALELEKADISKLLASGWKQPERFNAKGRDGKTDIYGVLWRPSNFDPARKYAVIENIYAGPHSFFVPATFAAYRHPCQTMAELGFLCVMVDGMGTSGRSKAFHAVSHKNLGDGGLPDHIAWMKALAARYPYMDLTRVGIFGHSAGGYNSTNALLTHPEFYKVAVSSAGNHDHRLDKSGWVEKWMGYPAGKHYEEQSNITLAPKLQGKLLLATGDVDENVPPIATLKLAAALVQAGKDFDLIIMPNRGHGFGNDPYFVRRRWDFFVRHLLGVEPPANYKIGAPPATE
jgi:dipeptidyl aminopeptidase/acylaminoacyl peptidase